MKYPETARRLRLALDNKGIIPKELADKSKVSKASISQYINGSHAPSNISSGKMAEVLGVSPVWLMGFDVPMEDERLTALEAQITYKPTALDRFVESISDFSDDEIQELDNYAAFIRSKR